MAKEKTKVYVVLEVWNNDGEPGNNVADVCSTMEKAKKALKKAVRALKKDWKSVYANNDDIEIEESDTEYDMWTPCDDYSYTCSIIEKEIN